MGATESLDLPEPPRSRVDLVAMGAKHEVLEARDRAARMAVLGSIRLRRRAGDGQPHRRLLLPPVSGDGAPRCDSGARECVFPVLALERVVRDVPRAPASRTESGPVPLRGRCRHGRRRHGAKPRRVHGADARVSAVPHLRDAPVARRADRTTSRARRGHLCSGRARELSTDAAGDLRHHRMLRRDRPGARRWRASHRTRSSASGACMGNRHRALRRPHRLLLPSGCRARSRRAASPAVL